MTKTVRILKGAKEHLEQYGWQRFAFGFKHGPCCAVGAINVAATDDAFGKGGDLTAYQAIGALKMSIGIHSLGIWNDDSTRTKEEVLAAFQTAIDQESK